MPESGRILAVMKPMIGYATACTEDAKDKSAHAENPLDAVLFDVDGTLLDTYGIILTSMRYTVNGLGGEDYSDAELMEYVGTPLYDQMLRFTHDDAEKAQQLVDAYRAHNDAIHDDGVRAFPDTRAALEILAATGLRMGVVTSKRHFMAERGLALCGLIEFFDVLIGSDDWPEHKPSPGPLLHGCDLLEVAPTRCAYVGDSPFDIQAANAAGCFSVAALWGMFAPSELKACNPDIACTSLVEVARQIEKHLCP